MCFQMYTKKKYKLLQYFFTIGLISLSLAEIPIIKIISPMEDIPIIAYKDVSILGEVKNTDRLFVNNYNVDFQNGLFRLKFKFSEPGYREFVFRAENSTSKIEKKLKLVSLETFPDIKGDDYQREIEILSTMKMVSSYFGTDFFRPKNYLRKAELARIVLMLKDISPTSGYSNTYHFQDLLPAHWAYTYIQLALNNGLLYSVNSNEFGPNRIVSREELIKTLKKFYRNQREENRAYFKDLTSDNIDHKFISFLASKGYLPLNWIQEDNFYPNKGVTRAELAYVISRIDKVCSKVKESYFIDLPLYKKAAIKDTQDDKVNLTFRKITEDVYVVECLPDKNKRSLFVELQVNCEKENNTVLLVDDGKGVDIIAGDNIFSGVINISKFTTLNYTYLYKIFDEYNLIYKVGEGKINNEGGLLAIY